MCVLRTKDTRWETHPAQAQLILMTANSPTHRTLHGGRSPLPDQHMPPNKEVLRIIVPETIPETWDSAQSTLLYLDYIMASIMPNGKVNKLEEVKDDPQEKNHTFNGQGDSASEIILCGFKICLQMDTPLLERWSLTFLTHLGLRDFFLINTIWRR